jgi:ketosteroid isomerase-like protein
VRFVERAVVPPYERSMIRGAFGRAFKEPRCPFPTTGPGAPWEIIAPTREGYLRALTEYHAAHSNTRYVIEKQLAEGDEVVTTFAVGSTHDRGECMGLVPTGKQFEALLILVHRVVGGKIAEE